MPGHALELALATSDIRRSFEFWTQLGFGSALTGDIWTWPYGVMTAPRVNLGLHAATLPSPQVVLVRPDVAGLVPLLQERGVEVADVRLGADAFNELQFFDPAGVAVRVLEARTFSPAAVGADAAIGTFDAVSWPAPDADTIAAFWQRLHVECETRADDWALLRADVGGMAIAWHSPRVSTEPLLVFRHPRLQDLRGRFAGLGIVPQSRGLGLARPHALFASPEGQKVAILA
ncbi:MAG: hypothetical protein ABI624_14335 [Casimicrobiaceae bacterium]